MGCTKWTSGKCLRIAGLAIATLAAGVIISHFFGNHTQSALKQSSLKTAGSLIIPLPTDTAQKTNTPSENRTQTYTVRKGDTLASLLHRAELPSTIWMTILNQPEAARYLEHLETGQSAEITTTPAHQLVSMTYDIDLEKSLQIEQHNNQYLTHVIQKQITKALRFKSTVIHHSLEQAEKSTGLPSHLEHELNAMFANGGIAHNIHPGDRLAVLYHEYFVNDQADHPGNIVAAEITHGQKHYRIVRYTTPNHETGYYKPNGEGTKPEFLKAPLHYERIGSRFNYHRYDPVLHRVHPHLGVDFDAPKGTPVKAIGDGIVVMCKQMRGYGNVLMIRYNQTYKTLYAHLEKFASQIKPNERVKKGEVVGYVGMTGWSTGPHLHFSLFKNGVAVNPLTVQFPQGSPLPEKYRQAFDYKRDRWFSEMNLFETAALADNQKIQSSKQKS
ncbi:MAG: hypothetical protein A3F13_05715 [Gammaproteobacteria bacterium RIFCSPHIGHO2_12_FULL_40_19]|nr:MAG: hypothetical protein A3F13_05715 [Gammaproteobacteria bacterium RIFCSPHIGHO2_12_FULL_40_19]